MSNNIATAVSIPRTSLLFQFIGFGLAFSLAQLTPTQNQFFSDEVYASRVETPESPLANHVAYPGLYQEDTLQRISGIFWGVLGIFFLYWLNTRPVREFFKRAPIGELS